MKFSTDFISATKEYATLQKWVNAPMFRKAFTLPAVKNAQITICGLGFYELFVNGNKITRGFLSSYTANPDHILYYDNYDIVPYLNEGENVIGVMLGNGMLNNMGGQPWKQQEAAFRSAPKFAMTLEAETVNGEKTEFTARDGFKCCDSPILFDDLRAGEFYDARLEQTDWNKPGFDDSHWREPLAADAPLGECILCDTDPIVTVKEVKPVSIKPGRITAERDWFYPRYTQMTAEEFLSYTPFSPNEEGYIYDFGINAAGVCRIHIKDAKPGQKLVLQFAEKLYDDGGLDIRCICMLPKAMNQRAIYICKGGDETWEQTFTYFGYRYVLVMGLEEHQATEDLLTYVVRNTKLSPMAEFECSHEVVNRLWRAALQSNYANFYHYPTDCPHREKLGWTADIALSAEQMLLSITPERNFKEWMRSVRKVMRESGAIPCYIPTVGNGFDWGAGPAWDQALVIVPYYVWLYRGQKDILEENAAAIYRYLQYIASRRDDRGLIHIGLGDWAPSARARADHFQAPLEFTDTAICMDICRKAETIFRVLGQEKEAAYAATLWSSFRAAARKYLINFNTMTSHSRCQTSQAMAIYYDIFDAAEKPLAFEKLVEIIHNDGDFIYCGVLGVRILFHVLSDFGRADLAFKMITRPEYPSFGYMMRLYDSTLWESFVPDEGMPASRNHHFLGDIISWFMKNLVGIRLNPYAESIADVHFAPKFLPELSFAKGSHQAPLGKVSASWVREGEDILYTVSVPEGMRAELYLENGWKTDNGLTWLQVKGEATYRIIPEDKFDNERLTSSR